LVGQMEHVIGSEEMQGSSGTLDYEYLEGNSSAKVGAGAVDARTGVMEVCAGYENTSPSSGPVQCHTLLLEGPFDMMKNSDSYVRVP
jgi:hypothetical protein